MTKVTIICRGRQFCGRLKSIVLLVREFLIKIWNLYQTWGKLENHLFTTNHKFMGIYFVDTQVKLFMQEASFSSACFPEESLESLGILNFRTIINLLTSYSLFLTIDSGRVMIRLFMSIYTRWNPLRVIFIITLPTWSSLASALCQ